MTCIVACDQDTKCYSLNYRFPSKTCELSNSTRFADLQDFLFSPDVVYFDHLSRPSGSCVGDAPCKNSGRCVSLAKAPGFKCNCYKDYTGETCNGNYRLGGDIPKTRGVEEESDGLARTLLFPFHARSSRSRAPKFPLFSDRFQTAWQVD